MNLCVIIKEFLCSIKCWFAFLSLSVSLKTTKNKMELPRQSNLYVSCALLQLKKDTNLYLKSSSSIAVSSIKVYLSSVGLYTWSEREEFQRAEQATFFHIKYHFNSKVTHAVLFSANNISLDPNLDILDPRSLEAIINMVRVPALIYY